MVLGMKATHILHISEARSALATGEARRLRIAAGLSTGEVADACGVDQSTVWRWEARARRPRGAGALAYAKLLRSLRTQQSAKETEVPV